MMSSATRRTVATSIPPTQNTAPVHEYRCLYTHDVVRKQKRWQDGRVKYHTFNRRLMLYDDTLQFIGDTHCKEGEELSAGDQIKFDIGVLITLEDLLHTTQTDLAPLFDREKNRLQQAATTGPDSALPQRTPTLTRCVPRPMQKANKQKHCSLNSLINTNRDAQGRVPLPMQSPYDARMANVENDWGSERKVKCRRRNDTPDPTSKTSMHAAPSGRKSAAPIFGAANGSSSRPANLAITNRPVVDITLDVEVPPSEALMPYSPNENVLRFISINSTPMAASKPVPRVARPAPRIPVASSPHTRVVRPASPPISTQSKIRNVDALLSDELEHSTKDRIVPEETPIALKTKTLRLAKTQQRPMLLCEKKSVTEIAATNVETSMKKRRSNMYQALSDSENEQPQMEVQGLAKKDSKPIKAVHKKLGDLVSGTSSSKAAFETGQSNSPPRSAARRKHASVIVERPDNDNAVTRDGAVFEEESIVGISTLQNSQAKQGTPVATRTPSLLDPLVRNHDEFETTEPTQVRKKLTKKSSVRKSATRKSPSIKAAARATKAKSLKTIIDRSNEIVEEIGDGIGSKAIEERAKMLATSGQQQAQGAWTIEATDLFDWRPPDWEQRAERLDSRA